MQNSSDPTLDSAKSGLAAVQYLRSPQAIRERCGELFKLCLDDQLQFRCDLSQLDAVADYVIQVIQQNYPDWQVPFHSRWRHFQAGGIDRLAQLAPRWQQDPLEYARIQFDLAVTSVLLDAGAGTAWRYREPATGKLFQRSEGLAVASYDLFLSGSFSSGPTRLMADAAGLQNLTVAALSQGFQLSESNPLVGLEGRLKLLQQLGLALAEAPALFGTTDPRPGGLVDYLTARALGGQMGGQMGGQISATDVFAAVLAGFSPIWPGRVTLAGENLGDVWQHSKLPIQPPDQLPDQPLGISLGSQLVPFHKLSQWLTYSLLEPLQQLGFEITNLDQLTGLAEYRNGGLCLDLGLLQPKQPDILSQPHRPDAEVIVEWRALTILLLDQIAAKIREKLDLDANSLPLVKVLEGGTWAAGRKIAATLRADGRPPLQIISDGTVF
ncbi:MAG: URC4/urg3 family protein [Pegethrix bostrychoides GSE-TBD4-15B]|jgi:hypothetical protein|uniref:URC4/urg3 family protein n=1 Tax=Pegethrix bostrychoides GSE-TBD4-15B TaxID=2839662 RepID=A0A951U420_9CYAN|nr:URC4/urg3 family protein [Pegethrix bostrychoides GSE-TBD4-15B]